MATFTAVDDPQAHFQIKLYTGEHGSGSGTSAHTLDGTTDMQPDLVWIKTRSNTSSHQMHSALTAEAYHYVKPDATTTLTTSNTAALTSFNSDGFTLGSDGVINENGYTYVAWCWKANGSGSANTDGNTNTTKTSANTTAGFSMITYDGDGAAATLGHGLGDKKPKFIIQKNLSDTENWQVQHGSKGATYWATLNTTNQFDTNSARWNDTEPTTSLITIGSDSSVSQSGENMFMLAWAEVQGYSSFGSFVGNGETGNAGNVIMTGFRPALVIIKKSSASGSWLIFDSKRASTGNVPEGSTGVNSYLEHTTGTEQGDNPIIFLSNGFQCRDSLTQASGATYIYAAWAEQPFVNSNGVPCNAR